MNSKDSPDGIAVPHAITGQSAALLSTLVALLQTPPAQRPSQEVIVQVARYKQHVHVLANQLELAIRAAIVAVRDEVQLARMASDLLRVELERRSSFTQLLTSPEASTHQDPEWQKLGDALRDGLNQELAAMRDGRLRLEFRRAEMINQQRTATRVRVVLRGGAQVRLYLNRRTPDDAAPG